MTKDNNAEHEIKENDSLLIKSMDTEEHGKSPSRFKKFIAPSTPRVHNVINNLASSPLKTPKTNIEFSKELKQVLHERNVLTTRTKKRVFDVLDEIEVTSNTQNILRRKENAVFEIITSEKNYVQQLEIIMKFFMKPIREKELLNDAEFEILFGNIPTIYSVNEALLKELYKGSNNIANAFLKIAPYFKMYSLYAMEFKNILSVLQRSEIRNPEFYKFMGGQETRPEVRNKLSALLIAPIQRLPRYKLLLQQLHELTSPSDPDYLSISDSLAKVEEAADHINNVIEDQENIQMLLEVQRCLKGNEPSIITPGRKLLKQGELLQFDGHVGPSVKFYVILLNDLILFCKMKSSTVKPKSLKCKMIFPLSKCTILENAEKGCFQVHCQGDDLILYDRSVTVTKEWIHKIEEAIHNCLENKKTLRKESSARRPVKRKDINEYNDVGLSPGVPLKRRRQTIDVEIIPEKFVTARRSLRSKTPTFDRRKSVQPSRMRQSEPRTFCNNAPTSSVAIDESTQQAAPSTDLFVFGQDNPNTSFTFKLTNMISSIGSSVVNMFKFRR